MKSTIAITEYKVKDVDVYSNAVKVYTSECGIDTERYDDFDLMPILIFLYDKGEYLWLWDILPLKVKDLINKHIIGRKYYRSTPLDGVWK